jgi:hypothetical protein
MTQKYAYLDLDGVAYIGSCIAEKVAYIWKTKEGVEPIQESQEFPKAKEAKQWYEDRVGFEEIKPDEWERHTIPKIQDLSVALKGVDLELNKWKKSCHDLFGDDIIFKGYLTCSGIKNKDIHDLQNRYQHTRFANFKEAEGKDYEHWEDKPKPMYLAECRNHLLNTYDWIIMSPPKLEADAIVVGMAERKGQNAVVGLKDKDLMQVMDSNYINMNDQPAKRKLVTTTEVGELWIKKSAKDVKSLEGNGFKLIAAQTPQGDSSDGYKGIYRFGPVDAYELLNDAETVDECCKRLVELYQGTFPDGIEYPAWQDKDKVIKRTWKELLIQHMNLAYHERGSKDTLTPIERYFNGENPTYKN